MNRDDIQFLRQFGDRIRERRLALELTQADFVALVDRHGQLAVTTRLWPTPDDNFSDRDYFKHFKNENDTGIYISSLLVNRLSGMRTMFFSKRLSGANNEFLGVVVTGIRLSYFESVYNSITRLSTATACPRSTSTTWNRSRRSWKRLTKPTAP